MFEFIAENIGTIAVVAVLIAIVAAITVPMIINKKKGRRVCSGGCAGCAGCSMSGCCRPVQKKKKP